MSVEDTISSILDAILVKRNKNVSRDKITVTISRKLANDMKNSHCHWHLETPGGEVQPNRFQGFKLKIEDDKNSNLVWEVSSK